MAGLLHVWPERWRREGDETVISATLEWPENTRETFWYRVPEAWQAAVTHQLDPFALALVMLAMRRRVNVRFRGRVSPSLLANLEEYQTIWHFWKPDAYDVVDLSADQEEEAVPAADGAIVSFSGGADACYTVYRHVRGLAGRRSVAVKAGLMLRGFDIPLDDPNFETAVAGGRRMLDSLGVPLITAATNWRELERTHRLDWLDSFGSAILSCQSLFSAGFRYGLLGSGDRYYNVRAHGSTPLTDPLLGSDSFRVRNDGGAASRVEKISLISEWPEAMRDLRVCWEGVDNGRNCSRCEKCIRTILNFRAVGQPLPPCFEHDVTLDQIRRVPLRNATQLNEFESIVAFAEESGMADQAWVQVLRKRIAAYIRNPSGASAVRRLRRRLALRTRLRKLVATDGR